MVDSKEIYLGLFGTAVEGAIAYNNYIIMHNLEHTLNEIENGKLKQVDELLDLALTKAKDKLMEK